MRVCADGSAIVASVREAGNRQNLKETPQSFERSIWAEGHVATPPFHRFLAGKTLDCTRSWWADLS